MAQVTSKTKSQVLAANVDVAVPQSGNTILLTIPLEHIAELGIEINVADQAIDAFIVEGKMHPSGAFQTLYSVSGDYTTPTGLIIGTSGDLTAQAAGTTGWILFDVSPLYELQISVSSANVAGSAVTARAIGKGGRIA